MTLPETIPVRYTEDEAGYVSIRPVVRQTFQLAELADMVLSVTGKDAARVEQIFRAGSVTYNGYRYWWQGFSAGLGEVESLLAPFPNDEPSRPFRAEAAAAVLLESGGGTQRALGELKRADAGVRRLFHRRSAWDCILDAACESPPVYEHYSYPRRADLYRQNLSPEEANRLLAAMMDAAPRGLRARLNGLALPASLLYICPRPKVEAPIRGS